MSRKSDNIVRQLTETAKRLNKTDLEIVETGTIRNAKTEYVEGDGHSTAAIAKWICENGCNKKLKSIDLDVKTAREYLKELYLAEYVDLIESNSLNALEAIQSADFCYLDSANDAELTFKEFQIVRKKMSAGSCIMVDDCNVESVELHKGDILLPYLDAHEIKYTHFDTNQIAIIL